MSYFFSSESVSEGHPDKVTDIAPSSSASTYPTNLGIEKGTLTPEITAANCQVRIGTLTIRYN